MRAVRLREHDERPLVEETPEPEATHPFDVVVRIGSAGPCRTVPDAGRLRRRGILAPEGAGR
ncbi:MAG TPA: hypothetical protein VK204_13255 [Nocardioidaceae bacterium]|nr:hypothetical protein [Nocardioidaceae bacterium]